MPVNKRLSGPTRKDYFNQQKFIIMIHLPISEPSTKPDTEIPRVEHASKNRDPIKIKYDGQNPNFF